ncbi:Histone-lysine N-methyltransferase setd7 [Balamuthia mandrillaris]
MEEDEQKEETEEEEEEEVYEGEIDPTTGLRHGEGTLSYWTRERSGGGRARVLVARYRGHFREGKRSGHGCLVFADSQQAPQEPASLDNEAVTTTSLKKRKLEEQEEQGQQVQDEETPEGAQSSLEGNWEDDCLHGRGVYRFGEGEARVEGTWHHGELEGADVREYDAKGRLVYHGSYKAGRRHGPGVLFFAEEEGGGRLEGTWQRGHVEGESVRFYFGEDGSFLEGEWDAHGDMVGARFFEAEGRLDPLARAYSSAVYLLRCAAKNGGDAIDGGEEEEEEAYKEANKDSEDEPTKPVNGNRNEDEGEEEAEDYDKEGDSDEDEEDDVGEEPPITSMEYLCPMLPDPYEEQWVYVKQSNIEGAGEGLFAKRDIPPRTVLSFYAGIKVRHERNDERDWSQTSNALSIDDEWAVDVPPPFDSLQYYCASLGHKANHCFRFVDTIEEWEEERQEQQERKEDEENKKKREKEAEAEREMGRKRERTETEPSVSNHNSVYHPYYHHPRFGKIKCLKSIRNIRKGEEIYVDYTYDEEDCPPWFRAKRDLARQRLKQQNQKNKENT